MKTAKAVNRRIRVSGQKLNLVARTIAGLPAEKAIQTLTYSPRRIADTVKRTLMSAIANAENNHQLDPDRLVVHEIFVGKSLMMKRYRPRAKGRASPIQKPFSNLTIIVAQPSEARGTKS